ncbi:hypothetical protein KUCAC02_015951, partial [Chaenocephalus aceratus]
SQQEPYIKSSLTGVKGGDIDTPSTFKGGCSALPSADIAKVSAALILFDFIHAKVISDSGNGGVKGLRAMEKPGKHKPDPLHRSGLSRVGPFNWD